MPAGRSDMCLLDLGLTSNQVWGLIRTDEARTGLHRIGSDVVNTYLVEDASGVMIVDAALPGHWRELNQELRQLSYSLDHVGASC
jgi:hypothetical protein